MMVTMAICTQLFAAPITPQLVLAVVLVATSTLQYNLPKEMLRDDDDEIERTQLMGAASDSDNDPENAREIACTPPAKAAPSRP